MEAISFTTEVVCYENFNDLLSYAGGSWATGWASLAG